MTELYFNNLTPAELERLALLSEELGEVQQTIGKIIRHGYENCHPDIPKVTNRTLLEEKIGHVLLAIAILSEHKDIDDEMVDDAREVKRHSVAAYLHHNGTPKKKVKGFGR